MAEIATIRRPPGSMLFNDALFEEDVLMSETQSSAPAVTMERRSRASWIAFLVGIPVASAILYLVYQGPLQHNEILTRYLKHEVECVELILFCCAISAFGAKFWSYRNERAALRSEVLPPWDGQPIPVDDAQSLRAHLSELPRRVQNTFLVCRIAAILDYLGSRHSASELDDQMRSLTDNDALALEGSYSLTRFITWAIPILGFLGTVLGITQSISGVTPEKLEHSLGTVTDGLALAFDATALGLGLTMVTMFVSFLVERAEQGVLESVDRFVDHNLAHRFERVAAENGEFVSVVRQNADVLLRATEQLVKKQADVWAQSFAEVERQRHAADESSQQRFVTALETALVKTLETHARRLTALEQHTVQLGTGLIEKLSECAGVLGESARNQQAALAPVARGLAEYTDALCRLQEGDQQLLQLQEAVNRNMATLAGALQGFEFRVTAPEFRVRLEAPEPVKELTIMKPRKAA